MCLGIFGGNGGAGRVTEKNAEKSFGVSALEINAEGFLGVKSAKKRVEKFWRS